jgi:acetyltransferase
MITNLAYGGYTGVVYPVNPRAASVLGNRCITRVSEIDGAADLVVIAIPAPYIEGVVLEASEAGTRHFVVISAGFKETGSEGKEREDRLKAIALERGLTIVGPNCLGVINTDTYAKARKSGTDLAERGALHSSSGLCEGNWDRILPVY